ncbi:G22P2 [Mytilus edulis]|uniref:XRCC5 n=1 Tax=Mytilus edulis TaxID=6550 RepID=A0A8S3URF1_MYTED|nr:G22P2 [Mytilus edulis]
MIAKLCVVSGTVTPVEDYLALVTRKDVNKFDEASKQMQKRIQQIVTDSFGAQFYPKAIDCLKTLREQCIKVSVPLELSSTLKLKNEAKSFNIYMRQFKDTLIQKGRRDFWDEIVTDGVTYSFDRVTNEGEQTCEESSGNTIVNVPDYEVKSVFDSTTVKKETSQHSLHLEVKSLCLQAFHMLKMLLE